MAGAESNGAAAADGGRRRHVLLFPLPYQGHINPMFRLAGVLHARGFAVTVFHTHLNAPDPARHPEYRFVPVPDGTSSGAAAVEGIAARILALGAACAPAFRDRLAAVLEEYSRDAVACLVADAHWLPMVEVSTRLAVPTLALRTGSAACFAGFLAYPMLCDKGYLPVQESELDTPATTRCAAAVKASSGLILNTFDALERRELADLRRDLAVPVFDVGPLHRFSPAAGSSLLRQDRSCLEWLDAMPPASVLYVSFGSLACMTPRDLAETAWGLAGSGVPFLWALRPGMVHGRSHHRLPEGFEAAARGRGVVVEWAPQEEVLRHRAVGGFWTHNGWNSTTESVGEGVPMLCRPCFGDQMVNAMYVEHVWGVGFEARGELERGSVEAAIRRLMADGDGAEMRARAGELKEAAAECTGEGGPSRLAVEKLVTHIMSL
ncbi:hypothetical protein ACP4OV_008469 [Aristida adscensionis]